MANTHKTNKARIARALNKKFLQAINGAGKETINQVQGEIKALGVNGKRYGDHRKMKAREKVMDRRIERKALNRTASLDA